MFAARERQRVYIERVIPARTAALRELQLEQNYMLTSVFDLLTAKQREALAALGEVEARRDYWLASVDLDRAVGGGKADLGREGDLD
jgi:cobalt-zinc-cadmium efflux system outer membrane protein